MDAAFEVHILNEVGKRRAKEIATAFDVLLNQVKPLCGVTETFGNTHFEIAYAKLEEACFFCKKSMASRPVNQE